eukprot:gb/GEZJ01001600.1/.p1 GENE.gb/GEZJ01001600.1/~~gb/GEZJ01001600.1/.p1  ORF type:complete len:100 (-),score=7.35 gb/GEZJ01001600.1/:1235-1534(-)
MAGKSVLHVVRDRVHHLDCALHRIGKAHSTPAALSTIYAMEGCDFTPGKRGIGHETYTAAYMESPSNLGCVDISTSEELYENRVCLAFSPSSGGHVFRR